jgi:glycine/sarcosine N-methyltransferase
MGQPEDTIGFYDDLADHYHLIYENWETSIGRQAEALDSIIQSRLPPPPQETSILDCSCGIGTQAIGLALLGYRVHGTDISPRAVERASRESARLGAKATFGVADMRSLSERVTGTFDVVLSCDNAIPHLMLDDDLRAAVCAMRSRLRPEGLLLVATTDYDRVTQEKPRTTKIRHLGSPPNRRLVFQVWDWAEDGRSYRFDHLLLTESGDGWQTHHGEGRYRALLRHELESIVVDAGFTQPLWNPEYEGGYFEQVLTALSP